MPLYVLCLLVVLSLTRVSGVDACPPGQYRVVDTGLCGLCSDLCQSGDQREVCESRCPGFKRVITTADRELNLAVHPLCPAGSYFDVNVDNCDLCSSICDLHQIQHTSLDCKTQCPKEYEASLKKPNLTQDNSAYLYIVIPVLVAVCVVTVVTGVVVTKRRRGPPTSATTTPETTPLQCSDNSIDRPIICTNISPATGPTEVQIQVTEPQYGFKDLPSTNTDLYLQESSN